MYIQHQVTDIVRSEHTNRSINTCVGLDEVISTVFDVARVTNEVILFLKDNIQDSHVRMFGSVGAPSWCLYIGVLLLSDVGVSGEVDPGVRGDQAVSASSGEADVSESMSTSN